MPFAIVSRKKLQDVASIAPPEPLHVLAGPWEMGFPVMRIMPQRRRLGGLGQGQEPTITAGGKFEAPKVEAAPYDPSKPLAMPLTNEMKRQRADFLTKEFFSKTKPIYAMLTNEKIIIDGPAGEHWTLIDERGSGWMTEGDWHNWYEVKRKSESRARERKPGYNRVAENIRAQADGWVRTNQDLAMKQAEEQVLREEQDVRKAIEDKARADAQAAQAAEAAAQEAALREKAAAEVAASRQAAIVALQDELALLRGRLDRGEITQTQFDDEAKAIGDRISKNQTEQAQIIDAIVKEWKSSTETETAAILASRAPALQEAKNLVIQLRTQFDSLPKGPDVRLNVDTGQRKTVEYYDQAGKLTHTLTLVDESSSGWMMEDKWPIWNRHRRDKTKFEGQAKAEYNKEAQQIFYDLEEAKQKWEQIGLILLESTRERLATAEKAVRMLELPRRLTDAETAELQATLKASITAPPTPPEIVKIVDTETVKVYRTPHGRFDFRNEKDSGWMRQGDWENWWRYIRNKEYQRAKPHQIAYNLVATALMEGKSVEEAEAIGAKGYDEDKKRLEEEAKKEGIKGAVGKVGAFFEKNKGTIITVLAAVAIFVPVIGLLLSGILASLGKTLNEQQKKKLAEEIAKRRQKDLEAAKKKLDDKEIGENEYQEMVRQIAGEEAPKILEEWEREKIANQVMARPETKQMIEEEEAKASARKRKIALAVGGSAAGAAAIAALAWALI